MVTNRTKQSDFTAARSIERRVWQHLEQKRFKQAVSECEQLNQQYPDFPSGWHTASQLALKVNSPRMALQSIENALSLEPDSTDWLLQKALCLTKLGDAASVSDVVSLLSDADMKSAYQSSTFAMLLTQLGRREQAVTFYEKAAALKPGEASHHYNIACLQRSLGDAAAAERNFDEAIRLNPADYESCKLRSELRRQTPTHNHVEFLQQLLKDGVKDKRGEVHVCYALAKELEDLDEAERSFHYLKTGAGLRRGQMQYDLQRDLDTMNTIRNTFDSTVFNSAKSGDGNTEAIFVLGLPRTGTTLVERILSSHSDVFAAGELNNFSVQMMNMLKDHASNKKVARDELVKLSASLDFQKLGDAYIKSTRPFTGHTARFIDKLPLNYLYVGLIRLALPNAKIVVLERNPMDTCYAIYKQLFIDAYPFSYDLAELAHYFVGYHQLMQHWYSALPGTIHTVVYEELVVDVEGETRRLLEHCELEWQPECLRFYENKEASTTASTSQVRQPVYKSSVAKWRRFESQLQPVADIFTAAGIRFSDQ